MTKEEREQIIYGRYHCSDEADKGTPLTTFNEDRLMDVDALNFPPQFQIRWDQLEIRNFSVKVKTILSTQDCS